MAAADEKVRLTAQHIVRTLATSKNAADDMIRILSGFDDRFNDLFPSSAASASRAATGDDHPATSGEETPAIGGDPTQEPSGSPLKGYQQSPRATVHEVNDQREASKERDGISEDDSVKLEMAEKLVLMWDSSVNSISSLFEAPEEAEQYLSGVDDLISLSSEPSFPTSYRVRAESSLQLAMSRLEDEFRNLLSHSATDNPTSHHSVSLRRMAISDPTPLISDNPESPHLGELEHSLSLPLSSDVIVPYLVLPDTIGDLKQIALRMIAAGYEPELCQAYSDTRREALTDCLSSLGVDKMSIEEVQKIDWPSLDSKMKKWIQALKIVHGVLLEEKRVCETVFETSNCLKDECFAEAAKGCVLQLLNFGDAVAIGKRTSEKLFRIVGMYEALADVLPDLESLFSGHAQVFVREEAEGIFSRLGDAVKGTLLEFGNLIRGEMSKKPLQYGEIHPLTRYVMNYIGLLADYSGALNSLLADEDAYGSDKGTGAGMAEGANLTPLGNCMLILITYLETNLDEKKRLYEDEALQHIFMMNNLLYIVQKVKDSEMKTLLGDNWVRKRRGLIRQHSTAYLRASWTRVLSFLRDDGLGGGFSNRNALKEKFKNFNNAFDEIYRVQTNWRVPDPQLREELKISISEKAVQAYRSFYGRSRGQFEGRSATRYIKYAPEDLENHVADLFEGFQGVPGNPRGREAS
ncbi:exocyst complex component EXO70B1-like protein [Carex littledalei]|uniref:Exocyst subunit Exo70 family protein n=1 Tax=Carex littledalei TaxID=544730 RepID=A0A833R999_9POAL|nr:exocyst complex component EXO70B1-like protein [Carex littledalei]